MSVPIATSPGRSGFGPQLNLTYDSGAGNGPFGFGWSLSLPAITRKTDKGLPKYQDAENSDVFILSGAEDLVPEYKKDEDGNWILQDGNYIFWEESRIIDASTYVVRRYRPRIENLFARIEHWTNHSDPQDTFWRSISKDNITSWYGKTAESRISDPSDASHIFSWLISQSYDDKGNAIIYEYAGENDDNVNHTHANERNRTRQTNRYLKRIKYGNRAPNRDENWQATDPTKLPNETWIFEVLFDYGEGHYAEDTPDADRQVFAQAQITPPTGSSWPVRQDMFSTYRTGFEVRTYRLCCGVLMFHHFRQELGIDDCLVRSTQFSYDQSPIASFIASVTQSGYLHEPTPNQPNRYLKKSFPPVAFEYSKVPTSEELARQPIQEVDTESLENLPAGLDSDNYQWMDLDGEGTNGILTEQGSGWYYKRNLSANNNVREDEHEHTVARLGPVELVAKKPAAGLGGETQFLDLAGDGQVDLAQIEGAVRGFYERTQENGWEPFQPFSTWPELNTRDPALRFVDLTGDGHADILITEGEVVTWYPSLAEAGFGPAVRVSLPLDEEKGPRLVFADSGQSVYLADFSGDGLSDLVRIRNGEVCYWPNVGYGHFGAKVTMDRSPWFDTPDQFDQRRIRLADTDGSGSTDIIYLRRDSIQIYFNQNGNSWSEAISLPQFPQVDPISSVQIVDLLGNGTACLVWSSPLPGAVRGPMRYLALMEKKPHLMVGVKNNLGAETKVYYAPSTKFYLDDKRNGKPWITRLPFVVHVVEQTETYDHISRNRFVTRYAYHHGYFDGVEREFRGFGMVEQRDTEQTGSVTLEAIADDDRNWDAASFVPTVLTKTWIHTGAFVDREHISNYFAGLLDADDQGEYYREPGLNDTRAKAMLLPDTALPDGLTADEEREACRALKGAMLRQEVYALDGTDKAKHPYSVTEQNFSIEFLQPKGNNGFAVFFTHSCEAINYYYERNPTDPRIQHAITLEVDRFGNALKSVEIGYGRRQPDTNLSDKDQKKQTQILTTYTDNVVTNAIDLPDDYRTPLPAESRTYELTGIKPLDEPSRFTFDEWTRDDFLLLTSAAEIPYEQTADSNNKQKRLIERVRATYRRNDLTALLRVGLLESLALPGESYKLAFTPGLLTKVYRRGGEELLPIAADVLPVNALTNTAADRGGYLDLDNDGHWWIPSGKVFLSPNTNDSPAQEVSFAREHFFLPHRYRDPFHLEALSTEAVITFDNPNLLMRETHDAFGNTVVAESDYRVLQPYLITDPNGNRTEAAFDVLGMVVGTAVEGKITENLGDNLSGFEANLLQQQIDDFHDALDPHTFAPTLIKEASIRIVYDLDRFHRSQKDHPDDSSLWEPPYAATLARETHAADTLPPQGLKIQISFGYSDGLGREIQKKIQAEPGPIVEAGPETNPRWVGSGWTIFNNKGNPVRQYEPFFDNTHKFKFANIIGVSPILIYDPVERVVATLHPNHTWEKVIFDPWQQVTYDVNDTVTFEPQTDPDVSNFFTRLAEPDYLPTWHDLRTDPAYTAAFSAQYPDSITRTRQTESARKTQVHANTPTIAYADSIGRTFLTVAHNKFKYSNTPPAAPPIEEFYETRVIFDIEGNQREVIDAKERVVMRSEYDMLGNPIHQASMEAGERWMLNNVIGKPIRSWDSRGFTCRTAYDQLQRPAGFYVTQNNVERLVERTVYGESLGDANNHNARIYQIFDGAGIATNEIYDFKGNLLRSTRKLVSDYKAVPDWSQNPPLDAETFEGTTRYDALNRPIQSVAPHSSLTRPRHPNKFNVIQPIFNEANLLEGIDVWLERAAEPSGLLDPTVEVPSPVGVVDIDYDAKGQRLRIDYKNGASTFYSYDPFTFRLTQLLTQRNADVFPSDNPQPPIAGWPGRQVQDLQYIYDPAGNITHIQDDAQQTIYFKNHRAEPSNDYTYDALYRLIQAEGREHLGQIGGARILHSHDDAGRVELLSADAAGHFAPNDGNAMGTYTERYVHDAVGNFLQMQHRGSDPAHPGWTRRYMYSETSLIEPGKQSNRLSRTQVGNGVTAIPETYLHDVHGNMLRMPHLGDGSPGPNMHWDYKDQLCQVDKGGGGTAYYIYDASGQRVRKVWEKLPGLTEERIYLGGFEIFRRHGSAIAANTATLERETLHVMDDKQRIALVETRTLDLAGNDQAPGQLIRYQFGNHLGSASLELDEHAQLISYEEYAPYGSSTYQAVRSQTETAKRYRYTGKERDEETGFTYHGARYYSPWFGRWVSTDPVGIEDGVNLYSYGHANPVIGVDITGKTVIVRPNEAQDKTSNVTVKTSQEQANEAFLRDIRAALSENEAKLFSIKANTLAFSGKDASKLSDLGQMLVEQIKSDRKIFVLPARLGEAKDVKEAKALENGNYEIFSNGSKVNGLIIRTKLVGGGEVRGSMAKGNGGDLFLTYITAPSGPVDPKQKLPSLSWVKGPISRSVYSLFKQGNITQTLVHELSAHVQGELKGEPNQDSHFSQTTRFQHAEVALRDQENIVGIKPDPMKVLNNTSLMPFYRSLKMEKQALENLKNKLSSQQAGAMSDVPNRREADVKLIKGAMIQLIETNRFMVDD